MEKEIFKIYRDNRGTTKGVLWEISNYGNVRRNGEEYIPHSDRDGYLRCSGGKYQFGVHRVVAELFISNPLGKPTVDHINRIKTDNRACNLRWATYKEQAENRASQKGKQLSEETRARMSAAKKGKKVSDETRQKMSAAQIGNKKALGNKNTFGRIWITNPITNERKRIYDDQLPDYLSQGYVRGMKI